MTDRYRSGSRTGRLRISAPGHNPTFPKKKAPPPRVLTCLAIAPVYNEVKMLPYKLRWHQKHNIPLYLMDNYSTDGTWGWIQSNLSHLAGAHRIDTDGAFDLRVLQAAGMKLFHKYQPDWCIWTGADLFYQAGEMFSSLLNRIKHNAVSSTVINLNNTGETPGDSPFGTYFYCEIGKPVILAARYHEDMELFGDGLNIPGRRAYAMPGALFNMGFTKTREEREETYRRRQLAWDRGMRAGQGRHYRKAAAHQWLWEPDPARDIRQLEYGKYYEQLQKDVSE